ncbi:hypothetical protein ACFFGV_06125 [Pontibacillus salicampi]|uniref:Lipoprotein n=1 Tax=Pontibacillus salicampi TaxID=1449801 RepID=A0ABV6LLC2_9BACI
MKKLLLMLGLATVLVAAGCANGEEGGDSQEEENQTEENTETEENNSTEESSSEEGDSAQSALMDSQLSLIEAVRSQNAKIVAVQGNIAKLSETEGEEKEELKTTIEEGAKGAQTAADEAISNLDSLEPASDLPDDQKETFNNAVSDLKSYFEEAKSALDAPMEADFSAADEKFSAFSDKMTQLYDGTELVAPDFAKELS